MHVHCSICGDSQSETAELDGEARCARCLVNRVLDERDARAAEMRALGTTIESLRRDLAPLQARADQLVSDFVRLRTTAEGLQAALEAHGEYDLLDHLRRVLRETGEG